jgi:hypothetical protein
MPFIHSGSDYEGRGKSRGDARRSAADRFLRASRVCGQLPNGVAWSILAWSRSLVSIIVFGLVWGRILGAMARSRRSPSQVEKRKVGHTRHDAPRNIANWALISTRCYFHLDSSIHGPIYCELNDATVNSQEMSKRPLEGDSSTPCTPTAKRTRQSAPPSLLNSLIADSDVSQPTPLLQATAPDSIAVAPLQLWHAYQRTLARVRALEDSLRLVTCQKNELQDLIYRYWWGTPDSDTDSEPCAEAGCKHISFCSPFPLLITY